ncbi:MAG TPA: nitrogen fixation protein NifH, partial [Thermoflexia bacterium]|nr:nitrogen fixation protein NifH [Thermoflexia bacterium]
AFSPNSSPSRAVHCLWGNMVWAMITLGYGGDERLARSVEMLARSVTGDGYPWYRRSGIQGPGFLCTANGGLPCAWGAVRVLWALNRVPASMRTPLVEEAAAATTEFLLRYNVARADYPHVERISPNWFKFGYPLGYVTDLLLNLEVLAEAGCRDDPRLEDAITLVLSKQDEQGRWRMEYSYNGKMWADVEAKGQPSKWVTLRAVRTLRRLGRISP